jgi:hypothetical protein
LASEPLSAQTPGAERGTVFPQVTASTALNERLPRLFSSPGGEVFRVSVRDADDPREAGGAVLLAVARPHGAWQNLLEIPRSQAGISGNDPALAISKSGDMALTYQWRQENPRRKQIRLARSDDGGKTWTQPEGALNTGDKGFEPQVAWGQGKQMVVVWSDERRGVRAFDIYARRSPDGGVTWDEEVLLSHFPESLGNDLHARPTLIGDGNGRYWTVWVGLRAGRSSLYLNRSTDGGRTWSDPVPLSGDSISVYEQSLHQIDDRMLLVWHDTRTGRDRAYAVTSTDGGVTWTSPVRVDHLPDSSPANVGSTSVVLTSRGEALVSWQDARNGRTDVFVARSTDWGRTWGSEDQRMDMDEPGTAVSGRSALAKAPDGRVAIVWEDDRDGPEAIYLRVRSAGEKPEWGPEVRLTTPERKTTSRIPSVAWGRDGAIYVAWENWDTTLWPAPIVKRIGGSMLTPAIR